MRRAWRAVGRGTWLAACVTVVGCGEPSSPEADAPAGMAPRDASQPAEPVVPPPLPRPSDPEAFVGQHVLVPSGATLHLGPEPGAATVVLRLPPAASERAPTPAVAMRVVGHEGGRLKLQPAAPELGCVPRLPALASFDVAVWAPPSALARVLGRAVEARFADGTSVKLRPGVLVGPPGERVEVSADGLRLAVPIAEGDVSTLYAAEPAPAVPTGLRKLGSGAPLGYAGGDPVLPESALVGGGLVLGQRTEADRTFVRVASRCAEVEAVVEPARLAAGEGGAVGEAGVAGVVARGGEAGAAVESVEGTPAEGVRRKGVEGAMGEPAKGRYAIRGPSGEPTFAGAGDTWAVEPGKPLTWPSGTAAGTTTAAHLFEVEPTPHGDRLCFAVAPSEAAVGEGETLPLCLLATDVTRREDPLRLAASAGILGMLATSGSSGHFLASPYDSAFGEDDAEVYGGLIGAEIGEEFGVGGLGLAGKGEGGGGTGEGTIGLGTLGTGGGGGGSGSGYSDGSAPVGPRGTATVGEVKASGLEAAAAEKVVARSRSQLRFCYEKQLATDPGVAGTLELSLEIEGGSVTTAAVEGEALPAELRSCVERKARRWRFEGSGSVTVSVTLAAS